jgi:hypothetical protein
MTIEEIIFQEKINLNEDHDDFVFYCEYKALHWNAMHSCYDDLCDYILFYFFISNTMNWFVWLMSYFPKCSDCTYHSTICTYYKVSVEIARRNMTKCGMYAKDFTPKFKLIKRFS